MSLDVLFAPASLGALALPNALAVAPMTRTSGTPDGHATAQMAAYYEEYAKGGFGLLITEGTYIDTKDSQGYLNQPGIATQAQADSWRPLVEAAHRHGAKVILQIQHAGAIAQGRPSGSQNVGPSVVTPVGEQLSIYQGEGPWGPPREITREEMAEVVAAFAAAAVRAKAIGFDGVELHGANGYLLDEFISATTNKRTDEYGGSARNRVRFDEDCVRTVREAVGPDYPVGIRLSQSKVNDFDYKWVGGLADAEVFATVLESAGASLIHLTEHDITQPQWGSGVTLAQAVRKFTSLPLVINGGLDDPKVAASVLERGDGDVVALGKPALANQDWPRKAQAGAAMDEFDFEMLLPLATLDCAEAWRARKGA